MNRSLRTSGLTVLAIAALTAPAAAQTFPADDSPSWVAFACGDVPSFDPRADDADFLGIEDVVGDAGAPAVFRAVDDEFLYLRLRIDEVADLDGVDAGWGFAFDLDDDLTDYEVLLAVDVLGDNPTVQLFRNPTTTIADSPADPADMSVATYGILDNARASAAASSIGGPDGFVAVAVPLVDLAPLGIEPATELRLWAGSTMSGNAIDGDLACHDGSGGGAPPLSGSSSDRAPLDPDGGGDDDPGTDDPGTDDGGDDGPRLEGGGGCAAATGASLAIPLLAALALRRRRRR
jgi:uncharacterized protein (TIGR03382 family)